MGFVGGNISTHLKTHDYELAKIKRGKACFTHQRSR